jgi:hypothetical protein
MKFLTAAITSRQLQGEWGKLAQFLTVQSIYADTLESWTDASGAIRRGKESPQAVLADWLSHSFYSAQNPAHLLDNAANRTQYYRSAIAQPWETLKQIGCASENGLDEWW